VATPRFELRLERRPNIGAHEIYSSGKVDENYFASRQLQRNLKLAFRLQTANREQIIDQLLQLTDDRFPKTLFRTDIASYYENIRHDVLLKRIGGSELTQQSQSLIRKLLSRQSSLTSGVKGVGLPRGIGLSAPLSDIYLLDFDEYVRGLPETVFYARYVDDIVGIFSTSKPSDEGHPDFQSMIRAQLMPLGLSLSTTKTSESQIESGSSVIPPTRFLGYEISRTTSKLEVRLTPERVSRLNARLQLSFGAHARSKSFDGRAARMLLHRVRYLASNLRLQNNKRNAFAGIFFSNRHLRNFEQLDQLDQAIDDYASTLMDANLASALRSIRFRTGFEKRTFHRWSEERMKEIQSPWSRP